MFLIALPEIWLASCKWWTNHILKGRSREINLTSRDCDHWNWLIRLNYFPAGINLLKVNKRNTRTRCEICSKLTKNTPEQRQWRRSGVFIVNSEHASHLVLVFLILTLNMHLPAGIAECPNENKAQSDCSVWAWIYKNYPNLKKPGWWSKS